MRLEEILLRPMITEKTQRGVEKFNRYGFHVAIKANKYQIKNAVEKLYNVKVLNVDTRIIPGKLKRQKKGGVIKTSKVKKASVQLVSGQSIEFFQGV